MNSKTWLNKNEFKKVMILMVALMISLGFITTLSVGAYAQPAVIIKKVYVGTINIGEDGDIIVGGAAHWACIEVPEIDLENMPVVQVFVKPGEFVFNTTRQVNKYPDNDFWVEARTIPADFYYGMSGDLAMPVGDVFLKQGKVYILFKEWDGYYNEWRHYITGDYKIVVVYETTVPLGGHVAPISTLALIPWIALIGAAIALGYTLIKRKPMLH